MALHIREYNDVKIFMLSTLILTVLFCLIHPLIILCCFICIGLLFMKRKYGDSKLLEEFMSGCTILEPKGERGPTRYEDRWKNYRKYLINTEERGPLGIPYHYIHPYTTYDNEITQMS